MRVYAKTSVTVKSENIDAIAASLAALADRRVLVGVPRETASRSGEPISNAELAYIHDNGAPEAHIPARPFMAPGVEAVQDAITDRLVDAAHSAVEAEAPLSATSSFPALDKKLIALGLLVVQSIKQTIRANIPPPLAEATVRARIRRRADPAWRARRNAQVDANIASGAPPGAGLFTALIDTGSLLNSLTFVIRSVKTKQDFVVGPAKKE